MINDGKLMIKNGDNRGIIVVNDDECMMIFRIAAKPGELQIRICWVGRIKKPLFQRIKPTNIPMVSRPNQVTSNVSHLRGAPVYVMWTLV